MNSNYAQVPAVVAFNKRRAGIFLRFLAETGRVGHASKLAGFTDPSPLYDRRKRDPEFKKAWEDALETAGDVFEDEAVRRGKEGVVKDIYYKGEVVGQERVYSDGLLSKLLDGAKRDKYNPKKDAAKVDVHVGLAVIPMTAPTVEDWERDSIAAMPFAQQGQIIDITPKKSPQPVTSGKVVLA